MPLHRNRHPWPLLFLLAAASPALGGEVFRWVDEQGITNFSQTPPVDPERPAQRLQLETFSTIPPVDVSALLEVAERLEASRLAREQARAAQRQAVREALQRKAVPSATTEHYHPPVLLHTGFRKPLALHPPVRPDDERPRRPHRKDRGPGLVPAVASGSAAAP